MGWMFLKTSVLICLVLPRISSSHPTQYQQEQNSAAAAAAVAPEQVISTLVS